MADIEKREETTPRANDWEVVSLTASTYAAAPSLLQVELNNNEDNNRFKEDDAEISKAMLMSGHFAYPQKDPQKLHVEPRSTEVQSIHKNEDIVPDVSADEGGMSMKKEDDNWNGNQFYKVKDTSLSLDEVKLEGENIFEGINLFEQELSLCKSKATARNEEISGPEEVEPVEEKMDLNLSQLQIPGSEEESNASGYPSEGWWKKHAFSLYAQAKEANAFWSIFVAATVMGLVILRQHWQLESWQVLQVRWQFSTNNEKMSWMLSPLSRFKNVLVGGNKDGLLTRSRSLADN